MQSGDGLVKRAGFSRKAMGWASRLGGLVLDQLYPPLCLSCSAPIQHADALCADCFRKIVPITAPYCPRLGVPFAYPLGPDALSAEAIADPPPFGRARAAVVYTDLAGLLVGKMKYGDQPELARFCARLMAGAGADLWPGAPLLVPVPLHWGRQVHRRFNQSTELARHLSHMLGLSLDANLLSRDRPTSRQVGLSGNQRRRNIAGAFHAHPDALGRVKGRRVVIVDDVITTGATVRAATRALQRAGVGEVDVISFARVVIGEQLPI